MNRNSGNKKPHKSKSRTNKNDKDSTSYSKQEAPKRYKPKATSKSTSKPTSKATSKVISKVVTKAKSKRKKDDTIRLNKYLGHSGICSRRDADMYIEAGVVKVNGKVVQELGFRVTLEDKVQFEDQTLRYQ